MRWRGSEINTAVGADAPAGGEMNTVGGADALAG
jgi:hypothetical protein